MPQTFMIIRCVKCQMFQVKMKIKSKKWICCVCQEKQAYDNAYFTGTSVDCRHYVQRLNLTQGRIDEELIDSILRTVKQDKD